jgi:hypothetical protein
MHYRNRLWSPSNSARDGERRKLKRRKNVYTQLCVFVSPVTQHTKLRSEFYDFFIQDFGIPTSLFHSVLLYPSLEVMKYKTAERNMKLLLPFGQP